MLPVVALLMLTHDVPHIQLFFFNDTATTEIYTLSLHDALPISPVIRARDISASPWDPRPGGRRRCTRSRGRPRSEEHTSELQSQFQLVCRLLLEKKKKLLDQPSTS